MTTELARYEPQAPAEYRARILMDPEEAQELDQRLRDYMRAFLHQGTDYGTVPGGGDKPGLFKAGAEKLLMWFGLGFSNDRDEIERDDSGQRLGVTYRCTIRNAAGFTVATCEGYAGYDEDKFYQSLEAAQAKAEAKERYWAAQDGRAPNPAKWAYVMEYRAPWNTVLKMAQKRALVGATLDATAAAALFADEDTPDASPAETANPSSPPANPRARGPRSAGEARKPRRSDRDVIRDELDRLGVTDVSDRAVLIAEILRLDDVPGNLADLTPRQREDVRKALESATDLDQLRELISDGVIPEEANSDGE